GGGADAAARTRQLRSSAARVPRPVLVQPAGRLHGLHATERRRRSGYRVMEGIPYTTDVRPDTGLTNPKLGIWLFLASEVMLFGSLFSSYALLRTGAPSWPEQAEIVNVPLAALNTVVLIASSVTMVMAWASLAAGKLSRYRLFMGLTLLGGALFLVVKVIEYSEKFS